MNGSTKKDDPEWLERLLSDPLDLPDDEAFESVPPRMTFEQILAISERALPFFNSRPDFIASKLARPFTDPFEL